MIRQYLSNKNESATMSILQKKFGTKQGLQFFKMNTVVFSFVFDKYYVIMN